MPNHVAIASTVGTFRAREGDARQLSGADQSADAVLLLGPLYDLIDRLERAVALREARRVLRPGGLLAAAGISRYLPVLELGSSANVDQDRILLASQVFDTGSYEPFLGITNAYFHRPDELRDEVRSAGLVDVRVLGIEGPAWMAPDAIGFEAFDRYVNSSVAIAELVETDPAVLSMSAHLFALANV